MAQIHKFQEIEDYIRTQNLNIQNKFHHFFIFDYEMINWSQYNPLPIYRQDYFEIALDVTAGCYISVDQFEIPSVKNRLTLISPDRLQTIKRYGSMNKSFKGFGLFFKPEFFQTAAANGHLFKKFPFFSPLNSPSVMLEDKDLGFFVDIIGKIKKEYDSNSLFSMEIIRHYLSILFLKAKQHYSKADDDKTDSLNREQLIYNEFKWLVHIHSLELKSVHAYAEKMNITPKHLSETIKKVSGESALGLIHNTQLNHAKVLLCQTNKSVSEIAYELNFKNPEYFSAFFKRLSGESPSVYRASFNY